MDNNNPLAPHALQTAVATMVERLLIEASYPAKGRDNDKVNKRHIARQQLADLVGALTIGDLPEEAFHIQCFRNFRKAPQQYKIWGGYTATRSENGEYVIGVGVLSDTSEIIIENA